MQENKMKLSFTLEEQDSALSKVFLVDYDTQWTTLVIQFADFLSAQYGYEVKEKLVFIDDFGIHSPWTVVGERTITTAAYQVAKEFDETNELEEDLFDGEHE